MVVGLPVEVSPSLTSVDEVTGLRLVREAGEGSVTLLKMALTGQKIEPPVVAVLVAEAEEKELETDLYIEDGRDFAELSASSKARPFSRCCQWPMPWGPRKTATARQAWMASSSTRGQGRPEARYQRSRKTVSPRSLKARATSSTGPWSRQL